ncbi:MAG: tetratricopeptide repeat protein [Chitinophagaceae bacterium]|nr:tetratricopeptide repeat protein [Chitinophagaceae bacterium]
MKKVLSTMLFVGLCVTLHAQTAEELFDKAMQFKAKENFTETAKLLAKALELDPENPNYMKECANANYEKRAYFQAMPLYESLLKNDGDNLEYLARLAEMYSMSPEKMKGVQYADRALKLDPQDGEINRKLARTYLEVDHFPKAIKLYQKAEKMLPEDKDIPSKLASCYAEMADYNNALKYFNRTMELDPTNATKIYEAAGAHHNAGKYNKAVELYQLAEDKGYYKSKMFYYNWGLSYEEMKDYKGALAYYNKAREYSPYDRALNFTIADVYINLEQFDKARTIIDGILEINPEDAEAIYNKGMTYYRAGNTGKAEGYFNKAFELDPSLKSLRYVKSNF